MDEERYKSITDLAHAIAASAAAGKYYTKNRFDKEHYENILKYSREILSLGSDIPLEKAEELLEGNDGYQTPKVETRAIIFNDKDEVLLVKDHDGLWNPPGGWCEYNYSVFDNTIKEGLEETGHNIMPYRLAAVFDHRKDNNPRSMFSASKFFVLCRDLGGEFKENIETTEMGYFPLDKLPELNTHKTNLMQLELCLKASKAEVWETVFD